VDISYLGYKFSNYLCLSKWAEKVNTLLKFISANKSCRQKQKKKGIFFFFGCTGILSFEEERKGRKGGGGGGGVI
jgi:hypothetical protein